MNNKPTGLSSLPPEPPAPGDLLHIELTRSDCEPAALVAGGLKIDLREGYLIITPMADGRVEVAHCRIL